MLCSFEMIASLFKTLIRADPLINHKFFFLLFLMILAAAFEVLGLAVVIPAILSFISNRPLAFFDDIALTITPLQFLISIFILYIVKTTYLLLYNFLHLKLVFDTEANLTTYLYKKVIHTTTVAMDSSKLATNLVRSPSNISFNIWNSFLTIVSEFLIVVFISIYLFVKFRLETLILICTIGICALVIILSFKSKISNWSRLRLLQENESIGMAKESLQAHIDIQQSQSHDYFKHKFNAIVRTGSTAATFYHFINNSPRIVLEFIIIFSLLFFLGVSLYSDLKLDASIEFLSTIALASMRLLPSFNKIIVASNSIRVGQPYLGHYNASLNQCDLKEALELPSSEIDIHVNSLEITNMDVLNAKHEVILRGVNFNIQSKGIYGITGPSGIGKSTFGRQLIGYGNSSSGVVAINGDAITMLNRRNIFKYISQQTTLIRDTVINNIAFGLQTTGHSQIQLDHAIHMSKVGFTGLTYDEVLSKDVHENGNNLSGGERQRILFARIIMLNPKILIIDEATSAIDRDIQQDILTDLRSWLEGRIVLWITHDRELISMFDGEIDLSQFANIKKV